MEVRQFAHPSTTSRREFLTKSANGFGALALPALLAHEIAASPQSNNPLAAKAPHFAPKAKAVIYLFMVGAPSQMETFDPKPVLNKMNGQLMPKSFGEIKGQFVKQGTPLLGSAVEIQKIRAIRRRCFRAFPAHRYLCRRHRVHPFVLCRQLCSRSGDVSNADQPCAVRSSFARFVGSRMDWAASVKIFLRIA